MQQKLACVGDRQYLQIAGGGAVVGICSNVVVLGDSQRTEHLLGIVHAISAFYRLRVHQTWQSQRQHDS